MADQVVLRVVKVKATGAKWAQEAIMGREKRYRGFHYKNEAIANLSEWEYIRSQGDFARDFYHNFHTAAELGITQVIGGTHDNTD